MFFTITVYARADWKEVTFKASFYSC
ncbi:hypothetical protein EMIT0P100_110179 [Pseudomonas sp. IT-P100]